MSSILKSDINRSITGKALKEAGFEKIVWGAPEFVWGPEKKVLVNVHQNMNSNLNGIQAISVGFVSSWVRKIRGLSFSFLRGSRDMLRDGTAHPLLIQYLYGLIIWMMKYMKVQ